MTEEYDVELLHFDTRVIDYRGKPILATRSLVLSPQDEKMLLYSAWEMREPHSDPEDYLSRIVSFQKLMNASITIMLLTRDERYPLADTLKKAYPFETDPAEITSYGLKVSGAGLLAWWNEEGKGLELTPMKISMGALS